MAIQVPAIEIIYRDGSTETVLKTQAADSAAEAKACAEGWNLGGERQGQYTLFWQLRHDHKTTDSFEQWQNNVVGYRQKTLTLGADPFDGRPEDTEN